MVIVPINTFKVGSPQVRISNIVNYLNDTATHEYIFIKDVILSFSLPSGESPQGEIVYLDNNYYNVHDSNVDGNGNPIYIRN